MPSQQDILQLLSAVRYAEGDVSLGALATRAGWSPVHFHRTFRNVVGETPKQYVTRQSRRSSMPMLSIERRELTPAHVLIVRARCARHELSKTMGECFGKAFPFAMGSGVPLAGLGGR